MITNKAPPSFPHQDLDRAPPQKTVESVLRKALQDQRSEVMSKSFHAVSSCATARMLLLIDRERKGLPFSVVIDAVATTVFSTGKRPEIVDAQGDLERVLAEIAE